MTITPGQPRVAVVVPTYNEKENVKEFKRRLEPFLESMGGRLTVLFVDDNSPDGTGAEIKGLMDADLQHPPEIIGSLIAEVASGGADVAIASRHIDEGSFRRLSLSRRVISKGASWYSRKVLGLKVKDTTTGFKALRKSAVECLLAHPPRSSGFVYQVESLYILDKNGFRLVEVPFTFEERTKGVSKMGTGEILGFFFGVLGIRFRRY
jgi:glycosyltransferase involved in cell wall biosynthesis